MIVLAAAVALLVVHALWSADRAERRVSALLDSLPLAATSAS